jgi:hypothetical protein
MLSCHLFFIATSLLIFLKYSFFFFFWGGVFSAIYIFFLWNLDIVVEGLRGKHTLLVQDVLKISFTLFLFSELMFFFSIFWVFFDASLSPSIELGVLWPPFGVFT